MFPILSVTGSDSSGGTGVQADALTIASMGGYPLTAVTAITLPGQGREVETYPLPTHLIVRQVSHVISTQHPRIVKVGLVGSPASVVALKEELLPCHQMVLDPGIISASGQRLVDEATLHAIALHLMPMATLLMLKCVEAELLLGCAISSDDDMLAAAQRLTQIGARWVMLRGASHTKGQIKALLYSEEPDTCSFFSSYNTEGWQRHGVGGALSTAIATRLGMGDDMPTAISKAHEYIHHQVVYRTDSLPASPRAEVVYNRFLSLLADNYRHAHDVAFYADKLCITTRYLSIVTAKVVGKSPRAVIAAYLIHEATLLLHTSHLTVQEVSHRLGFSSQTLFSRFFKNQTGTSPSKAKGG